MADLSDVTGYLAQQAALAVYPNGSSQPSIAPPPAGKSRPADVRIFEGWPIAEQLDADIGGKVLQGNPPTPQPRPNGPMPNVSVYALPGANVVPYQILDKVYVLKDPVFGLSVAVDDNAMSVTGSPGQGEFITLIVGRVKTYSEGGASAAAVLSALFAAVQADYPDATLEGNTLSIPAEFEVRQGGVGLLGKVTHRECQMVMVTVWAPDHATRNTLAAAIDVALKSVIVVTLPDGSDAKITYNRTATSDEQQNVSIYRRDLIYECEYATLQTFPGVTVTSVQIDLTKTNDPDNQPRQTAIS